MRRDGGSKRNGPLSDPAALAGGPSGEHEQPALEALSGRAVERHGSVIEITWR